MKIALIQSPVWWTVDPPLGLAQIAGCLKAAGHEVHTLDLNILLWSSAPESEKVLWNWENFHRWNDPVYVREFFQRHGALIQGELSRLLAKDIGIAGFSVCSGAHLASLELARMLKSARPSIKVFMGGQFFFSGETALDWAKNPAVDAVFTGAADLAVQEAAQAVANGTFPRPIPGVICRDGDKAVDGGPAAPIPDLDLVPFADLTGFEHSVYARPLHLPFQSSRGCIWRCKFCSSCNFWPGFSRMSGERSFAEVMHHKKLFPEKHHVEFYDIVGNGDVKALSRFTDLLEGAKVSIGGLNFFGWKINAVIRPEMTPELLARMRKSNCKDIIYGIESGSGKVLSLMGKRYDPAVALRVLADTHNAGIRTAANFMFGFPGETEEDFQETLKVLRAARPSLDKVYASATFTSLEQGSYLTARQQEFGIKQVPPDMFNNLYWETEDGTNNYLVRLDRYTRFRSEAAALGLEAYKGIQGDMEQERLSALSQYYRYIGKPLLAVDHLMDAVDAKPGNEALTHDLGLYYADLRKLLLACENQAKAARSPARRLRYEARIREDLASMRDRGSLTEGGAILWMGQPVPALGRLRQLVSAAYRLLEAAGAAPAGQLRPPPPPALAAAPGRAGYLRALVRANTEQNSAEAGKARSVLASTPRRIFLQIDGPCNADCLFCSRDEKYAFFDFRKYLSDLHPRIFRALRRAEELVLTGSGEILLLPQAREILTYFNNSYPQAAKQLATNASHAGRELWDLFCRPEDRYTLQISLHSATPETHRRMTKLDSYAEVMENLSYLAAKRAATGWPKLQLMFVMTTENIGDLPEFIRLGKRLGADRVIANHAYIYRPDQAGLSLQSRRAETNAALAAAEKLATELGLEASLPPPFADGAAPARRQEDCREPWAQLMINSAGEALPCDLYGAFGHNIAREGFWQVWNGKDYIEARAAIREKGGCYSRCPRHNPESLSRPDSLTISRSRAEEDAPAL
ncbi:MAG: radical SAM protein [Elusimicrobiales bacterium]|nr:radical SAM protein [Elusimicrobiales bacterium]